MIQRLLPHIQKIKLDKCIHFLEPGDVVFSCNRKISLMEQYGVFVINNLIGNVFFHLILILRDQRFVHFVSESYRPFYDPYFPDHPDTLVRAGTIQDFFQDSAFRDPVYSVYKKKNGKDFYFEDFLDHDFVKDKLYRLEYLGFRNFLTTKKIGITCNSFLPFLLEELLPKTQLNINLYYNPKTIIDYVLPYLHYYHAGIYQVIDD